MNTFRRLKGICLFFSFLITFPLIGLAQISSTADAVVPTEYAGGAQDSIHVFCGAKGATNAALSASYPRGETGNFEWQKYNPVTGIFDSYPADQIDNQISSIVNLPNGCYRVKINPASGPKTYTAWVFNNYIETKAEITQSECKLLTLKGSVDSPEFNYTDLSNQQTLVLRKDIKVTWKEGDVNLKYTAEYSMDSPPTKNTTYTFTATDRFGCKGQSSVEYISMVTKASFEYKIQEQGPNKDKRSDPAKNEAPLTVSFTNTSENGTSFEWFFYKSVDQIKQEKAAGTYKDGIMEIVYNQNPVYTYEASGEYKVKLVSKKVTGLVNCTDTFLMDGYIKVDTSFIDAPNVFTPNGDGKNDNFAIKFFSMKSVKIGRASCRERV